MKKFNLFIILCFALGLLGCSEQKNSEVKIGIIEPLSHRAMTEIVAGFNESFSKLYHQPVKVIVENAQNDQNLQRAIIQKMQAAHYTMIVPIGVGATEMTLASVKNIPVVSLASDFSEVDRQKLRTCNVAVVHDEISSTQLLAFIHETYPTLKHLTLIHSAADKVLPEVNDTIAAGKKFGITIDHKMVASLPELIMAADSLSADTQGIFVLKDSLIVSGISTLAKAAALKHIPLITSDQGSVQDGAAFALGVHEKQIGIDGGKLAAAVLNGKPICDLPIVDMTHLTVFVNPQAIQLESQAIQKVIAAAQKLNYEVEKT